MNENRLQKPTRRWIRESSPMVYHLAAAWGVDSSQVSRELNGERPSEFAKVEARLVAMARHPRIDPTLFLTHWLRLTGRERGLPRGSDAWDEYQRLTNEETLADGAADLDQMISLQERSVESLERVEDALLRHAAKALAILAFLPRVIEEVQ